MTTIDNPVGASTQAQGFGSSFVIALGKWMTSSDHKKIGRLFIGCALFTAVSTSIIGAVFGLERMSPAQMDIFDGDAAIQLISLYRFDLVLGLLAPLFLGIALAIVPLQLGSRAIAFPRLAQLSFWSWLFGALMVAIAIIGNGGPGGGQANLVDLYLLGVALAAAGILAGSLSVATSVLTARAPGMTLDIVPAFSWGALVGSVASLLTLPVAIGTIIYLYVDNTHAKVAFGGSKAIDDHLGWVFGQPMTIVFIVIALGVLADIAPVTAGVRQPQRPVVLVGLGLITTAVLGAATQSTHMLDWSGNASDIVKSAIPFLIFNGLPLLGIFVVIAISLLSLKFGSPKVSGAFALASLGAFMILVGAAGNFVAHIQQANLAGTAFNEGVTVYFAFGGLLVGLGALAHWAPKLWGRVLDEKALLGLSALGLLGTIASSFPLFIAGFANQPVDVVNGFDYDGPIALWNGLAGIGNILILVTVIGFVALLLAAIRNGAQASDDPWNGHSLEWAIPSPAPLNNFEALAHVNSSEPVLDAKPSGKEVTV
jgi:heme/copper-type cytochrome/quinol oxidase subunit 1